MTRIRTCILRGFDDPLLGDGRWADLLRRGDSDVLFLTREWLEPWWETRGGGKLLLIAAESDGELVVLAPLFATDGVVLFLGAGESDCLDFIGEAARPGVLPALLEAAREAVPDFAGFKFELVPDTSRTGPLLRDAARRMETGCSLKSSLPALTVDLQRDGEAVRAAAGRSMLKREDYFRRSGRFEVVRLREPSAVRPCLEPFFAQHVARWRGTGYESPFVRPRPRAWLGRVCETTGAAGWLRFLRLDYDGAPLGMGFSWSRNGAHYAGPWSFAIEHGRRCPGHVLLRHSLLGALEECLASYDLRGGADPWKSRLPGRVKFCQTWCLYPPG